MTNEYDGLLCFAITAGASGAAIAAYAKRWKRHKLTAYGTAEWADDKLLRDWGMLGKEGVILARTQRSGQMIRLPRYTHTLLIGGTGSGKGVGIIIPNLLDYRRGSVICFDVKRDLYQTTAGWRHYRLGQKIIRLDPFGNGSDCLNPLDSIPPGSPLTVESAGAMAEALVVRTGKESEPHWNDKAVQIIKALIVLVCLAIEQEGRNLNSVQDIASDPALVARAAMHLREIGGIPGRLGNHLKSLFENVQTFTLTKEGAGILSTVSRHLAFLDSEAVLKSVERSTFDLGDLQKPGTTLYLTIPPDQLEAQKGLLRLWVSTLIRHIGETGSETKGETLLICDEAEALGRLPALSEALVRGRSAQIRLLLAYQSLSQVRDAFPDTPTVIDDNCAIKIHMGPSDNYEDAERLSKSLGDFTHLVTNNDDNWGQSRSSSSQGQGDNYQHSRGGSTSRSQQGRPLLRPEELLRLGEDYLLAFVRGFPAPILGRRIKWYEDPAFAGGSRRRQPIPKTRRDRLIFLAVFGGIIAALILWAKFTGYGRFAPETPPAPQSLAEKRGFIGVRLGAAFGNEEAAELGLDKPEGALVKGVIANSPASSAGIEPGDVVLEIDGTVVRTPAEFRNMVAGMPSGTRVRLQLWRAGQKTAVEVEVGIRPQDQFNSKP